MVPAWLIRLENPIPIPALRSVNTYVIAGGGCAAVVDPGMGEASARRVEGELRARGLELELVVATHFHVDHSTAAAWLNARLAMGRRDWERVTLMVDTWPEAAERMSELFEAHGMPREEASQVASRHPALSRVAWFERLVDAHRRDVLLLDDGSALDACGRRLAVIHVPGHTPGHVALAAGGLVLVGDLVLEGITPNVPALGWPSDPLADYLSSLRRLLELRPGLLLPGHRGPVTRPAERIRQLIAHHERRLREAESIVRELGEATAYEVAARMRWDVPYGSWREFPLQQKYFAVAEAISHLARLVAEGRLEAVERGGRIVFRPRRGEGSGPGPKSPGAATAR